MHEQEIGGIVVVTWRYVVLLKGLLDLVIDGSGRRILAAITKVRHIQMLLYVISPTCMLQHLQCTAKYSHDCKVNTSGRQQLKINCSLEYSAPSSSISGCLDGSNSKDQGRGRNAKDFDL